MSPVFPILVATVVLAPLPFGARYAWGWSSMAVIVGVLLMTWVAQSAMARRAPAVGIVSIWPIAVPFLLVIAWIAAQGSPLAPAAWHHPLWDEAGRALGTPVAGSISLDPAAGTASIVRLASYAGIFWLALQYGRDGKRARRIIEIVAIAGFAYAAYGLIAEFTGGEHILWFDKRHYRGSVTATMEYKNAFATYAGLTLLCVVGLLLRMISHAADDMLGPRERVRRIASRILEHGWFQILSAFVVATALLLADSRGAMIATGAGIAVLMLSYGLATRGGSGAARTAIGALSVAGLALVLFSGDRSLDRLDRLDPQTDIRTRVYERTSEAIADSPLLGTGQGTFAETFAMYRSSEIPKPAFRAHNAYLDNALGLGIPGALALALSVVAMAGLCLRGLLRRQRNRIFPCIGIAATVLIGVHALFDFTLQTPAVTATFCLIMGAACGQSWSSRED